MTTASRTSPPAPVAPAPPSAPAVRPVGLASAYVPRLASLDEMKEPDGALRSHWRAFVSMLDDLGRDEILSRWEQARRLIRENGITHNVYDDPDGLARTWSMDLLPLLIPESQWQIVGAGLSQRARLLDALLADLYGDEVCISEGLLPPELVYANRAYLRPCYGTLPPGKTWLHLYAADLVRGADGQFRVLSDRTQAPSGTGYSLENRIVVHRVLPTVFAQCNAQRLAPFFIDLRRTLMSLAPSGGDNPRVVLLTPGPYNETYFEHAYLARYLGYTLVQGNDLTVRDCKVYLKTLSGLQRVDVILRRVDDDFCDPLELYPNSFLGVPGLMQAVRDGSVAVANALGSGAVQAPVFLALLPGLCKRLLGEELALPSVQTWWCGEEKSKRFVLDNLATLVIKPAVPTAGGDPVFGGELAKDDLAALAARIEARPREFVAQERLDSFMTPVFTSSETQSRRFTVRAFLAAAGEGKYTIMPGGLARVAATPDSLVVSLQRGGGTKDTWILADQPVERVSLLASPAAPVILTRAGNDLPSRVADDLFWLGRYVQRAESVARLARTTFNRLADPNVIENAQSLRVLTDELVGARAIVHPGPIAPRELAQAMFDDYDPSYIRSSVRRFHALARVLRDRISIDAWRILESINREFAEFDAASVDDDDAVDVIELLNRLVTGFLAFEGMAAESMTRGQPWRFLDMGLRVERGLAMARLLRAALVTATPEEPFLLDAVLDTADSSLTYRRRYLTQLEVPAVADLLMADESNPRSIAYQLRAIEDHLSCLPRESTHPQRSPDLQHTIRLRCTLRLEDLLNTCAVSSDAAGNGRPTGRRPRLDELLEDALDQLSAIAERLGQIFFAHAKVAPSLLSEPATIAIAGKEAEP